MECKIAHIEIPVKDVNEAKKFYETIFNWKVQINTGFTDYAFFATGDEGVGGAFTKSDKIAKGEIMLHIQVEDIPKTLEKIVNNKGKIVQEKTEINGSYGFYAIFEDNFGNILGLWSSK